MGCERKGEVRGCEGGDGFWEEDSEGLRRARGEVVGCMGEVGFQARAEGEGAEGEGGVRQQEEEMGGGVWRC